MANVDIDTAGTVTRPMRPESPGQDVGLDDPRPSLRATTGVEDPRWLWARVGDGGVNGQEVWVRYLAEDAPHGVPVVAAHGPPSGEPGARLVTSAPVVGYPASGRANAERNGAVRAAPVLVPREGSNDTTKPTIQCSDPLRNWEVPDKAKMQLITRQLAGIVASECVYVCVGWGWGADVDVPAHLPA